MRGDEVLITSTVALLVTAEGAKSAYDTPNADLFGEICVDLGNDSGVFDYELEGDNVAGGVYAFVGTSAADEGGLKRG